MSIDPPDASRGRVRLETGPKRVRAFVNGQLVVDTSDPVLVWEVPHHPAYYLPRRPARSASPHAILVKARRWTANS